MNKYRNYRYFPSAPFDSTTTTVMMFHAATKRMSVLLKRCYSTLPEVATATRTASTPCAVRLRRSRKTSTDAESDALPSGLTPQNLPGAGAPSPKANFYGKMVQTPQRPSGSPNSTRSDLGCAVRGRS